MRKNPEFDLVDFMLKIVQLIIRVKTSIKQVLKHYKNDLKLNSLLNINK